MESAVETAARNQPARVPAEGQGGKGGGEGGRRRGKGGGGGAREIESCYLIHNTTSMYEHVQL